MSVQLYVVVRKRLLVVGQAERLLFSNHDLESLTHLDEVHYVLVERTRPIHSDSICSFNSPTVMVSLTLNSTDFLRYSTKTLISAIKF